MPCRFCARENRSGRKFCAGCGAALAIMCAACGGENEADESFCGSCGAALAPVPAPPSAGERRRLTVMFCDVVDSAVLAQALDPEDLRTVLRRFQQACAEQISRFTGHIARFMGDGLLVYFGFPQAHDDDPQRAIRAGLAIVEAVRRLSEQLAEEYGVTLSARVGIHTGLVVLAEMGSGERVEKADVVGETPTIAHRLQEIAGADAVVISDATHRLAGDFFVSMPRGPQTLKGIVRPLDVYRVVGESSVTSRLDIGAALTPFVNREPELAALLDRWREARAGSQRIALIGGEPGVGKSRLVRELRERLAEEAHTRIELRCAELYQTSPFYPLIDYYRRALDFASDDTPEERLAKLERALADYGFPVEETVPLFATLLSLPLPPPYAPPALSPELQRQRLCEAVVAWLLEAARRQPVLLIAEDLHWMDPSTRGLIDMIVGEARAAPLLVVLTYRQEFSPLWPIDGDISLLTLERLAQEQSADIVARLGGGDLPAAVRDQIVARTDGVPLFVEEMTKMVLESGLLREGNGRADVRGSLLTGAIPETLHDSLIGRLDRLPEAKQVAQVGATLGREFEYPLVQAVSGWEQPALRRALTYLVDAGLLYQRDRPPRARYTFKHALVRDAAYQSLLRSTRQEIHGRAARALVEQFPEPAATQPEIVAHHFAEAGLAAEAVAYWRQAGALAAQRANHAEAIVHYRNALGLLDALPAGAQRDEIELALQNGVGYSTVATMGYTVPEAEAAFARARALARDSATDQRTLETLWGLWGYYFVRAEHAAARELAEQALGIGRRAGAENLLVQGLTALGWSLFALGEFERARETLEEAATLYGPLCGAPRAFHQPQDSGASAISLLASVLLILGHPDEAPRRIERCLDVLNEEHLWFPDFTRAAVACNYAWYFQLSGDAESAARHALRSIEIGGRHGFAQWVGNGALHLGIARAALGASQEAVAILEQGVAGWRASGARLFLVYWLSGLASAHRAAGDLEAAAAAIEEALAAADGGGEHFYTAEIYRIRGELTLARTPEDAGSAAADFERALALASAQGAKLFELRAAVALHRLRAGQGRGAESRPQLAAVYRSFTEGFDTRDLLDARALLDAAEDEA